MKFCGCKQTFPGGECDGSCSDILWENTVEVTCSQCGGDKGHHDPDGHWFECANCDGIGFFRTSARPFTLEDFEKIDSESQS